MAVNDQLITDRYALYNGDAIEVMRTLPSESIHFSIYSPPFGGLYHYSSDERDLSNCVDYAEFFKHYDYVIAELARLTLPGRLSAVHVTDIPSGNSGKDYLTDFPGDTIRAHEKHGWHFVARHTIWKEPLAVRNRTMAKALTHQTVVEEAEYAGVASADYLLMFRKHGESAKPIEHPVGLTDYAGGADIPQELHDLKGFAGKQTANRYSHWIWRRYASSIWDDIRIGRVLPFQAGKDPDDEKHVHPLQLDVIDRAVALRSMPGETVLTPFMGVGSEVYGAVRAGRRGIGIELKESYFKQAIKNLEQVDEWAPEQAGLFDARSHDEVAVM